MGTLPLGTISLEARWLVAFVCFVLLPGWLFVRVVLGPGRPDSAGSSEGVGPIETTLLVLASGYGLAILLALVLHALFRPIVPWQIAVGAGLLLATLAAIAFWRRPAPAPWIGKPALPGLPGGPCIPPAPPAPLSLHPARGPSAARDPRVAQGEGGASERAWRCHAPARCTTPVRVGASRWLAPAARLRRSWPVLLVLGVAAGLRLADLGWSEFQGDEARVVLRAMAALQGAPGALAAHRKVPGEVLLTYLFAGGVGQVTELVGRLPFALAGVAGVLAFYALARALFGPKGALAAGLLLAANGYFVAFGRILQYDSLAFFLGTVGLLCCRRFGCDACRPVAWAILGALTLASAVLVALGAIFFAPPALLLAWPGLVRHGRSWRVLAAWAWPVAPAILAALLVLGVGGVGDGTDTVWSYLGPRLGGDRPYWNAQAFLQSANHYLSTPYLLTMLSGGALFVVLAAIGFLRSLRARGAVTRRSALIHLALAVLIALAAWDRSRAALTIGALLLLVLMIQPARQPIGVQVALAWTAGPLLVHLLLVRFPGTHWREAFPGLILLLTALIAPALADRRFQLATAALVGALVVGSGHYAWVTLVQRWPEYQLTFPRDRHPLDWTNDDGRGIGGVFGVAHHHGWKALGVAMEDSRLVGGYATNESPAIAAWYIRRPQGCADALAYVFRVQRAPQDRNLLGPVPLPSGYQVGGHVQVDDRSTITISIPPGTTTRPGEIHAEPLEQRFDEALASPWRPVGELYRADLGAAAARQGCAAPSP